MSISGINRSEKTILVVDDEDYILNLCQIFLKRNGYDVIVTRHGKEALDVLRTGCQVDLVLMDLNMPVMGGAEALHHMRVEFPAVKVIISSGLDQGVCAIEGECQPEALLHKPYFMTALLELLKSVLHEVRTP